jgi:hypothetical protein
MYPTCGIVKRPWTEPGVKKIIDEPIPFKKVRDDNRFKKVRDDILPKPIRDPKLPRDPGPIKTALDPLPPIGRPPGVLGSGGLQPFSLATPHHAAMAAGIGGRGTTGSEMASYLSSLEQQLLDIDAAIAEATATAASANADIARLQDVRAAVARLYEDAMTQGR